MGYECGFLHIASKCPIVSPGVIKLITCCPPEPCEPQNPGLGLQVPPFVLLCGGVLPAAPELSVNLDYRKAFLVIRVGKPWAFFRGMNSEVTSLEFLHTTFIPVQAWGHVGRSERRQFRHCIF